VNNYVVNDNRTVVNNVTNITIINNTNNYNKGYITRDKREEVERVIQRK